MAVAENFFIARKCKRRVLPPSDQYPWVYVRISEN